MPALGRNFIAMVPALRPLPDLRIACNANIRAGDNGTSANGVDNGEGKQDRRVLYNGRGDAPTSMSRGKACCFARTFELHNVRYRFCEDIRHTWPGSSGAASEHAEQLCDCVTDNILLKASSNPNKRQQKVHKSLSRDDGLTSMQPLPKKLKGSIVDCHLGAHKITIRCENHRLMLLDAKPFVLYWCIWSSQTSLSPPAPSFQDSSSSPRLCKPSRFIVLIV